MPALEVNFDGLVGPTHNYAGLSYGNIASTKHKLSISNPKQAALQGLAKMRFVAGLGLKQGVLPPQPRPVLSILRRLGFGGTPPLMIERAYRQDPALLAACYSSSSMWAANAATVSPGADTADGRVHFTPANLISQFHRSLEAQTTARLLERIFPDESAFAHHPPLPPALHFSDEGAANHTRLCRDYGARGIEIFTYGRVAFDPTVIGPREFPARQTVEAGKAIARTHGLDPAATLFCRQSPEAIDAGAFHNDVVAVGNRDVLFFHEQAMADRDRALEAIGRTFADTCGGALRLVQVPAEAVPLEDAVSSYLFNSQLLSLPDGRTVLVAPMECQANSRVRPYLQGLLASGGPIGAVYYVDVRQSMQNGGGPACLRLRVVLSEEQLARVHSAVLLTEERSAQLQRWIETHYRDRIAPDDLRDPSLLDESQAALHELAGILELPGLHDSFST